jgi:hypothetical protein
MNFRGALNCWDDMRLNRKWRTEGDGSGEGYPKINEKPKSDHSKASIIPQWMHTKSNESSKLMS